MGNFFNAVRDMIIATLRLIMLQIILFVTGIHHILFNSVEISNISLVMVPQRRNRDKLAFMDDLRANNFDLVKNFSLPPAETDFKGDDEFDDLDDEFDDDDIIIDEDDDNDNDNPDDKKNGGK